MAKLKKNQQMVANCTEQGGRSQSNPQQTQHEFSRREVKYIGHILSQDGVRSDPDKVAAIVNMEEPTTVKELRRFLGMVNQLSKTCFSSERYAQFARENGFKHSISNSNHPQGIGKAERGVQTIKNHLKKESDPNLALWPINQPHWN